MMTVFRIYIYCMRMSVCVHVHVCACICVCVREREIAGQIYLTVMACIMCVNVILVLCSI